MKAVKKQLVILCVALTLVSVNAIGAEVTSPDEGSTFSGSEVTFTFEKKKNNSKGFHVFIGQWPGSSEIFNSQATGMVQSPLTVSGLPVDGSNINVRVYEVTKNYSWDHETDVAYTTATVDDNGGGDGGGDNGGGGNNNGGDVTVELDVTALEEMLINFDSQLFSIILAGGFTSLTVGVTGGLIYRAVKTGSR